MSVYSGFATRQQEHRYNECLHTLLAVLLKRVLKVYTHEQCQESRFLEHLISLHDKMSKMEENKYMQPHYSHLIKAMLIEVSDLEPLRNHLKPHREQIYFDASIPVTKVPQSRQQVYHKAKINSIDSFFREQSQTQPVVKHPNETQGRFLSRAKTNTPEKIEKISYFTPPHRATNNQETEYQMPTFNREDIFKRQTKVSKKTSIKKVPKIDKPIRTEINQPLSPRQFLRQTMMGQHTGNSFAELRAKQRRHKLVK